MRARLCLDHESTIGDHHAHSGSDFQVQLVKEGGWNDYHDGPPTRRRFVVCMSRPPHAMLYINITYLPTNRRRKPAGNNMFSDSIKSWVWSRPNLQPHRPQKRSLRGELGLDPTTLRQDRLKARALAQFVRTLTYAQALLPSMAFLDELATDWNIVVVLEKLAPDPRVHISAFTADGSFEIK